MHSRKVALLKISMDSVQPNAEHCGINDDTAFRLGVGWNRCRVRVPLCWFNEYVHVRVVILQRSAYRIFKKCKFSEQVLPVSGFLSLPFLTRFPHMRCHIQGQGFDNKMYISEIFTVVGYLHTAGFKNHQGINFAKCISYCTKLVSWWLHHCHCVIEQFDLIHESRGRNKAGPRANCPQNSEGPQNVKTKGSNGT